MRLYLSSFRMGDHPERLLALLDDDPGPAAVIANAVDGAPADVRAESVERELGALRELGLDAKELDLRDSFEEPGQLADELRGLGLVWLRGGNSFVLRYALAASGADIHLTDLLRRDALVWGGYSAGICILAPSLAGLETVDDPEEVRRIYGAAAIPSGLGVLDYAIVPHIDSPDHPESEACGEVAKCYRAEGVPHRTLRDGEAIVVHGDSSYHRRPA